MTTSQSPLSQATDDRLSNMLFQGEEIEGEFTVESARIAISTHRVLVFTPDGDGRRFDHADRPNVLDATVETTGRESFVDWGVRCGVYGAVLFVGGLLLRTSGVLGRLDGVGSAAADAPGAGVSRFISLLPAALDALTDLLLVGGGLLVVAAAALGFLYYQSRERELVIERAGRDPMRVPVRGDEAEAVARGLRAAVGTSSKPLDD